LTKFRHNNILLNEISYRFPLTTKQDQPIYLLKDPHLIVTSDNSIFAFLNFLMKGPYFIVKSDNTIFAFSNFSANLMTGFKRFSLSHWLAGI
jgi:hypothetical protein